MKLIIKNNLKPLGYFIILLGILLIAFPVEITKTVTSVIAFLVLLNAIFKLVYFIKLRKDNLFIANIVLSETLVSLVVSTLIFLYPLLAFRFLGYLLVYSSVLKLVTRRYLNLISIILTLIVAAVMITNPESIISFAFKFIGVILILNGFFISRR